MGRRLTRDKGPKCRWVGHWWQHLICTIFSKGSFFFSLPAAGKSRQNQITFSSAVASATTVKAALKATCWRRLALLSLPLLASSLSHSRSEALSLNWPLKRLLCRNSQVFCHKSRWRTERSLWKEANRFKSESLARGEEGVVGNRPKGLFIYVGRRSLRSTFFLLYNWRSQFFEACLRQQRRRQPSPFIPVTIKQGTSSYCKNSNTVQLK